VFTEEAILTAEQTRSARKARTRGAIVAAARHRFVGVGYERTTMRDVADAAGVAVGTIHAHFPDKTALLFACFHDQIGDAVALGLETVDPEAALVDQLVHLGRVLFAAYARHPSLSRVMFKASLFPPAGPVGDSSALLQTFLDAIAELHRVALARGELGALQDEGRMGARLFFSNYLSILIGGLGGHFSADGQPDAADRWADALRPLVVGYLVGFGAAPEATSPANSPAEPSA